MLVQNRMTNNPETISPDEYLSGGLVKMHQGGFRRLPVIKDGKVTGIITDRDLREHAGVLERTKISSAMSKELMTVTPRATLEQAAKLMLSHKITGLPVTDAGKLVGVITTSDILQAFLDMLGASKEGSFRVDFVLEEGHDLALAANTTVEEGAEITGVGIHRDAWDTSRVCYLHAVQTPIASLMHLRRRVTPCSVCTCEIASSA
jgi:acetoin utilization protein AcuB